jgi:hypothetical protein
MSVGGFLLGLIMMVLGFLMVRRTDAFLEYFGDVGEAIGSTDRWSSWKVIGIICMLLGFLVAFGLLELLFHKTFGRFFAPPVDETTWLYQLLRPLA